MLPTALVPVRIARTAKRRLAHVLGPDERMRLVRALYDHVTSVLLDAGLPVITLAPHPIDPPPGVEVWRDQGAGLNRAVGLALVRIGTPVIVVHADLPRLGSEDVEELLVTDGDVVVARAHDGGTNGLLLRRLMPPAFGPRSALVHAARARAAGLRARVVDTPGFALDVDDETTISAYADASSLRRRP